MKLTIKITKEVLEKTKLCTAMANHNCAIAYAVRCIFPTASVCPDYINLHELRVHVSLPEEAKRFIRRFDSLQRYPDKRIGLPGFSFTIDVPDSVIESIGIEEAKAIIEKSSTLELA